MKVLLILLSMSIAVFAGNKWPDNVRFTEYSISGFKADSLKFTPWFNAADLANIIVTAKWNDDSTAGFVGDSAAFAWGIQLGNISVNRNGGYDTSVYVLSIKMDTVNALTSANWRTNGAVQVASDGSIADSLGLMDSTKVQGYGAQTKSATLPPACFARIYAKGMTGNKVGATIKLLFDVVQFDAVKVSTKEAQKD